MVIVTTTEVNKNQILTQGSLNCFKIINQVPHLVG